jgi:hypothetical protein
MAHALVEKQSGSAAKQQKRLGEALKQYAGGNTHQGDDFRLLGREPLIAI